MAQRLDGSEQLNEIIFQTAIDSFPHRDNYEKITSAVAAHATSIEALENGGTPPASSSAEVIAARDEAPDLQTRIRDSQSKSRWGVFAGELNDYEVAPSGTPDDKVVVDTGQALVNGQLSRETSTQTLDPADFALAVVNPRIDVVYLSADGTVGATTGLPAAAPLPEQIPTNTIELAKIYLRPSGGNPNVPNTIRAFDNGTDSFVILTNDRFLHDNRDGFRYTAPANQVVNGAGLLLDPFGVPYLWQVVNATLAQDATEQLFGDKSLKVTNDGTTSNHYLSYAISDVKHLKNKWVTASAYVKMAATGNVSPSLFLKQSGSSPSADVEVAAVGNPEGWVRIVLQAFVDNDTTGLEVRIYPDGSGAKTSSVACFVDGVQLTTGLEIRGFAYPEPVVVRDDGLVVVTNIDVMNDLHVYNDADIDGDLNVDGDAQIDGDVHIDGILYSSGGADAIAFLGL